jgi:hypothetical protein
MEMAMKGSRPTRKIFIGSARESLAEAKKVAYWIEGWSKTNKAHLVVNRWDAPGTFVPGQSVWHQLYQRTKESFAAVIIFGRDDKVWSRGKDYKQPRDNALIEFGLFAGGLHPDRVVFCVTGNPKIPSDLEGLVRIDMSSEFINRAEVEIEVWLGKILEIPGVVPADHSKVSTMASSLAVRDQAGKKRDIEDGSDRLLEALREELQSLLRSKPSSYPRIVKRSTTLVIQKNGDGLCTTEESFSSPRRDMQVRLFTMGSDAPAEFDSLDLKVECGTPGFEASFRKGEDDPKRKTIFIFFRPFVPRGQEVMYKVSWKWPKMWTILCKGKPDFWRQEVRSATVVAQIRTEFRLHKSLRPVTIENRGKGGGKLESPPKIGDYRRYVWVVRDLHQNQDADLWLVPEPRGR